MTALTSTEWSLAARPVGMPKLSDFQMKTIDIAPPGAGEIQVKNEWMSVDPYMRGRMQDRESYVPPFQIGETMQGGAVGRVTVSNHPDYKEGDLVSSMAGWRTAWVGKPEMAMAQKLPEVGLPESAFLGVAGMPGLTAYAGLLRVAELKEGDTVFVSGAAGAVGSTVVQIAKIKGCTVIGSAGGKEKCDVVKSLGADHVIDYKKAGGQPTGPHNVIQIVGKQLKIQGFIVSTHADMQPDFFQDMAKWIPSGQMKYEETVKEGIEKAPEAFIGLFEGANTGKMLVKLG